jgi:hypothetical protein
VTRRNAREVLDHDVAFYRHEFDGPSPSLHSNHFRYALLEKLGGWWIDTDMILIASSLPAVDIFIARQSDRELNRSAMRFPPHHALMKAARERTATVLENARSGDTRPRLLTELQPVHAAGAPIAPCESSYARLDATDVERWAALRRDRDHAGHYNLVHDRELKRLRAELDARQHPQRGGMIRGLKRHFLKWRE